MKLREIKPPIDAYVRGLEAAGASACARALAALAAFLDELRQLQVTELARRGSKASASGSPDRGDIPQTAGEVARQLQILAQIILSGGAKPQLAKDLIRLGALLCDVGESQTLPAVLDSLRNAMMPEPADRQIAGFIERLKQEKGTAAFERTLAELDASSLKREDVVAIALSVYGRIAKGTSRKVALQYIRKPHDAFVSTKRGLDATGGRSAA